MGQGSSTSPWIYVGCGCGLLALGAVAVCGSFAYFGFRMAKEIEAQATDPAARERAALEALGTERLPDGYEATYTFTMPIFLKMVVLEDDERERGLSFIELRNSWRHFDQYASGERDPASIAEDLGAEVDAGETIASGQLQLEKLEVVYRARRGGVEQRELRASGPSWRVNTDIEHPLHHTTDGLHTVILLRCRDDPRRRIAIWTAPDPAPELPVAEVDYTGTPADPDEILRLVSAFEICS